MKNTAVAAQRRGARPVPFAPWRSRLRPSRKAAHGSQDLEGIDKAMEQINEAWKNASEEMYKAQQEGAADAGAGAQGGAEAGNGGDDVTDVEFEEVDDNK